MASAYAAAGAAMAAPLFTHFNKMASSGPVKAMTTSKSSYHLYSY